MLAAGEEGLLEIAELFGQVTDATSGWTATHSAGVAASAVALAERFGWSPRETLLLWAAGYLHDVGQADIPESILDKHGRLTPSEIGVMKSHTYHTFRILDTAGGMGELAEWAAFHHERLDGRGYPFRTARRSSPWEPG